MPAYNFKARFTKKVESGQKTQTIRKVRKYPTKVNTVIYLNAGMRTKHFRRLGFGMITSVRPFLLPDGEVFRIGDDYDHDWFIAEEDDSGLMLAKADGFETWDEFVEYFRLEHGLPFEGEIIKWRLLKGHDFGYPEKENK